MGCASLQGGLLVRQWETVMIQRGRRRDYYLVTGDTFDVCRGRVIIVITVDSVVGDSCEGNLREPDPTPGLVVPPGATVANYRGQISKSDYLGEYSEINVQAS